MVPNEVEVQVLDKNEFHRTRMQAALKARQVAPISLNRLVEEGVCWYRKRQIKPAVFKYNFTPHLYKTLGQPAQLRLLVAQLIDCLVTNAMSALPAFTFSTQNIALASVPAGSYTSQKKLPAGWYVLLSIQPEIDIYVPSIGPNQAPQKESESLPLAWEQIVGLIHQGRGGLLTYQQQDGRMRIDIVLPAMVPLQ